MVVSYVAYVWFKPVDRVRGIYLIPKDAVFILESNEPIEEWNMLRTSNLWKTMAKYPFMDELEKEALFLDTLIRDNAWTESAVKNNHFLMSVHMISENDYDFLYALDLKRASGIKGIKTSFNKLAELAGWVVTSRNHKAVEIMEIMDPNTHDRFQWCVHRNYLVCSFNNRLVEKSIEETELPKLGRDKRFMDVSDMTDDNGFARVYIQYSQLPKWLGVYSSDWKKDPYGIEEGPMYSCFDMDLDNQTLSVDGYTQIHPQATYLNALMSSGKSDMTIQDVLSNRTAYYVHMGFDDIGVFVSQVERVIGADSARWEEYNRFLVRTEKLLQVSVKEDLLGWIDDEIILAQLDPVNTLSRKDDLVVVIEAQNQQDAVQRLGKVSEQIRKRTPAKFKSVQYKQYTIHYLAIKGFFSTFFGKLFEDIAQPYYVILDRHVLFSNNPKTLIGMIEDFESNRTLAVEAGFENLIGDFKSNSTAFLYMNGWLGYQLSKDKVEPEYHREIRRHEGLFHYLDHAGLQLVEQGDIFKSTFRITYGDTSTSMRKQLSKDSLQALYDHYFSYVSNQQIVGARSQIKQFVQDGWYKRFYQDSSTLEIEAQTKDALFHGKYLEYHSNGKLRVKGRFRKGRKSGKWTYYKRDGAVLDKERF